MPQNAVVLTRLCCQNTRNHMYGGSHDNTSRTTFWCWHTHTDRQTNALKTIPAFTMAARRLVTTARLANWTHLSKIVCTIAEWLWTICAYNKTWASSGGTYDHSLVTRRRLSPVVDAVAVVVGRWSYDGAQVAAAVWAPLHVSASQLERVSTAWCRREDHLGEGLLRSTLSSSAVRRRVNDGRVVHFRRTFQSDAVSDDRTSTVVRNYDVDGLVETRAFVSDARRSPTSRHRDRAFVRLLQYRRARTATSGRHGQFRSLQRRDVNFRLTLTSLCGVEIHRRCRTAVAGDSFAT